MEKVHNNIWSCTLTVNLTDGMYCILIQGGAEKRENLKLTMRFRPVVKFLLHTQYARGFVNFKRLVWLWKKSLVGVYCLYVSQKTLMLW
jgi:hypothetical protein